MCALPKLQAGQIAVYMSEKDGICCKVDLACEKDEPSAQKYVGNDWSGDLSEYRLLPTVGVYSLLDSVSLVSRWTGQRGWRN